MWRDVMVSFSFQKCYLSSIMTWGRAACTKGENLSFSANTNQLCTTNTKSESITLLQKRKYQKRKCTITCLKSAALPRPTPQGWSSALKAPQMFLDSYKSLQTTMASAARLCFRPLLARWNSEIALAFQGIKSEGLISGVWQEPAFPFQGHSPLSQLSIRLLQTNSLEHIWSLVIVVIIITSW